MGELKLTQEKKIPAKGSSRCYAFMHIVSSWEIGIVYIAAILEYLDAFTRCVQLGFDQRSMSKMSGLEKGIYYHNET